MPDGALPPATPPNTVPPAEVPSLKGLTTLAVAVVVVAALAIGKDVFIPIVLAILLGFVLAPVVSFLRRCRFGRVPSVVVAVLLALGIIVSLATVIGLQVAQLAADLPRYEYTIRNKVDGLKEGALGRASEMVRNLGRRFEEATEDKPAPPRASQPVEPEAQKPIPVEVRERERTPLEIAQRFLLPIVEPLATTGIVLVVVIFILLQREDLRDRLIRLFGSHDLHRTTAAMDDAAQRLSRYFLTQLGLNASFGLFIGLGLWAIGVPSPALWGVFAALMRFVPYIGSILAGLFPALLAAAVDPGWSMALLTIALFGVSEPLMGHVVEPLVYGQSTGLSPFSVVVSAIFWTWLWGPIGLILATPLTLCLVVLGRHVERLEFLDVLLGDRPALTPAENFYQRMLAGDPDEAEEYAEQLLKERSLSSYYDEVALKGLQLAANDLSRGVMRRGQLQALNEAVHTLVADLDTHEDVDPEPTDKGGSLMGKTSSEKELERKPAVPIEAPPREDLPAGWRTEGAILCIAGRGPLDEAASAMLAQLLRKHGLGARVAPFSAVSRSSIANLDVNGVLMVCVSYLEISGNPAHLRYLLRRLRQRLPNARVLVGLWPSQDAVLTDEALRRSIGADDYVSTLRDAVQSCLDAAHQVAETGAAPAPVRSELNETVVERIDGRAVQPA